MQHYLSGAIQHEGNSIYSAMSGGFLDAMLPFGAGRRQQGKG
jgi:hypothetical protein